MLAGTGLGNDVLLAHALSKQNLPQDVINLVATGVIQILALEPDVSADISGELLRVVQRRGTSDISTLKPVELIEKILINAGLRVAIGDLTDNGHQRLRHKLAAPLTPVPNGI